MSRKLQIQFLCRWSYRQLLLPLHDSHIQKQHTTSHLQMHVWCQRQTMS